MSGTSRGDWAKLVRDIRRQGWSVVFSGNAHRKVLRPDGSYACTMSASSSDVNGVRCARRQLRSLGCMVARR